MSLCYSIIIAHGKLKRRRRAPCTRRHSRRGQASKPLRISDDSKQPLSHLNITRELSSCSPEECDEIDWKSEEPESEQEIIDDDPKHTRDFIREMFNFQPGKRDPTDYKPEVKKQDEPDSKGNDSPRVWEWVRPDWVNPDGTFQEFTKPERQTYRIGVDLSRMEKNVLGPEAPTGYYERKAAALSDAIRLMQECLKTTSCCFEDEPYNLGMESYDMFQCDLSDAEVELVCAYEDVGYVQRMMQQWESDYV